jgi:cell division topological specificity factor
MLTDILERFFARTTTSRQQVKDRLRLVLAHDRTTLPPHILESMQKEILEVVSRYVELETEAMEFSLENDQRSTILIANLPIRRLRTLPSEEAEKPVETANLQIPDLTLTEDGDAIATPDITLENTAALEETVSTEAPSSNISDNVSIASETITRVEDAEEPENGDLEPTNADLDLSNLDFSLDSSSDSSNSDSANSESAA